MKKTFEQIKQSEARLRKIIDTIPALVWCGLPDVSKEFFNQRWHDYTGLSPEEAHGWGWKVTIHPDDIEKLIDTWSIFVASGEPSEVEARIRRFDGQYRWFLFRAEPLRDEALWTYLTTPFLLAMDGVRVEETEAWREGAETWRVLRAYFPGSIETHSLVQDFFFGEDLLLRRHDYSVNIAGGFGAAQLTSDYVTANGVRLPTKRRAYTRGPDRRPILDMLMVSIDISEVRLFSTMPLFVG